MSKYKTPKVYVEEIDSFPSSVVQGGTAIPVFVGYTGKKPTDNAVRINSMMEYEQVFGGAYTYCISVNVEKQDGDVKVISANSVQEEDLDAKYNLYYQLRMYFANGGGVCYVISAGEYDEGKVNKADIEKAMEKIGTESEATIIMLPDSVLLNEDDCYDTYKMALDQCESLKDRFVIVDVLQAASSGSFEKDIDDFRDKIGNNNLKYGASYGPYLNTTLNLSYDEDKVNVSINSDSIGITRKMSLLVDSLLNNNNIPEEESGKYDGGQYESYVKYVRKLKEDSKYSVLSAVIDNIKMASQATSPENYEGEEKDSLLPLIYAVPPVTSEIIGKVDIIKDNYCNLQDQINAFCNYITDPKNVPDTYQGDDQGNDEYSKKYISYVNGLRGDDYKGVSVILSNIEYATSSQDKDEYTNQGGKDSDSYSLKPLIDMNSKKTVKKISKDLDKIKSGIGDVYLLTNELVQYLEDTDVIPGPQQGGSYNEDDYENYKGYVDEILQYRSDSQYIELKDRLSCIGDAAESGSLYEGSDRNSLLPLIFADGDVRCDVKRKVKSILEKSDQDLQQSDDAVPLLNLQQTDSQVYYAVKSYLDNVRITLPPSGSIAGIYSRVDRNRGVWQAPANISLNNVISPTVKITDGDQADMNVPQDGKAVNAIRSFTGKGILVWGARTLDGNSNDWRYVNVRRLFNTVEKTVRDSCGNYLFEPNVQMTWTKISVTISNYLESMWNQGALAGSSASQAYFVNVGLGKTMTAQDILEGRMIVKVGIAPVRPAEFLIIEFSQLLQQS